MQPEPLGYFAPTSVEEAVQCLAAASGEPRILAGGTDLLVQLRSGMVSPSRLVDIKHIPETRQIERRDNGFWVGAAISGAEFNEHPELPALWPGVAEAFDLIGSTQIQGRATLAGNLCNASPAADSVPAMIAADVQALVAGPSGERTIPVEGIVTGPGQNCLAPGEFIVGFHLADPAPHSGDAYLRLIPRTEMDIAVVGAGAAITLDADGTCIAARIALGAVAPRPLLVEPAGQALVGTKLDDAALNHMAEAARAACQPIDDKRGTIAYRTQVAGVLARRAAERALQRAQAR